MKDKKKKKTSSAGQPGNIFITIIRDISPAFKAVSGNSQ